MRKKNDTNHKAVILLLCVVTLIFGLSGCKDGQTETFQDSLRASFAPPSGYVIVKDEYGMEEQDLVMLNNADDFIRITSKEKESSSEWPPIESEWQSIFVGNLKGYYMVKDNYITLLWCTGRYVHMIWGPLTDDFTVATATQLANSRMEV